MATESTLKDQPCPTRLITDSVTTEDAFQHRAIAEAIADTLLHEQGGCAIGLTGSWGSGKSTVIELLKKSLNSSASNVQLFVFDAWAHQGDPLRRSFLETLITWCIERRWIESEEKWRGVVEELARRKEEVKTENTPHLTSWGIAGALLILLAPVALQCYAKAQFQYHPYLDACAFLLSALPFLFGLAMLLYWQLQRRGEPLPSLVFTSTGSKVVSKTSRVPDPTSVEFEKYYRELLTEVLDDSKRQLVLVIDNLDRVNHDDARSIWASLRVFFDPALATSGNWYKRVWVLVPFDREGVEGLWDATGQDGTGNAMSKHFLEKTFQATFRVPPIILSNWEGFLLQQLRFAFPNHSDDEFHTIFRLYDQVLPQGAEPPTPRNIKIFVNDVGSLHRQWRDTIPLADQAAYALIARSSSGLLTLLSAAESNDAKHLSAMLAPDWQRRLAAIHFNVPQEAAYQVLLAGPVNTALHGGDGAALLKMENNPGFPEVLEETVERYCGVRGGVDEPRLPLLARAISYLRNKSTAYFVCWHRLYIAVSSVTQWKPFNHETAQGISKIVEAARPEASIVPLIVSVAGSLSWQASNEAHDWARGVATILPAFIKRESTCRRGPLPHLRRGDDLPRGHQTTQSLGRIRRHLEVHGALCRKRRDIGFTSREGS